MHVDIRIGIANTPRELSFESAQSAEEIEGIVTDALGSGSTHFTLTDEKGTVYIVPLAAFTYIEVGPESSRRIGFVA